MFCYFLCRLVYDEYVIREYLWPAVVYEYAGGAAGDLCQATISSMSQYDPSTQRRGRNGTSGVRSTNQVATMCVMNMHLALWVWIWRSGWLDTVDSEGDGGFRIWGACTRIFFWNCCLENAILLCCYQQHLKGNHRLPPVLHCIVRKFGCS